MIVGFIAVCCGSFVLGILVGCSLSPTNAQFKAEKERAEQLQWALEKAQQIDDEKISFERSQTKKHRDFIDSLSKQLNGYRAKSGKL